MMKKQNFILLGAISVLFAACSNNPDTPNPGGFSTPQSYDGIDFGIDQSEYALNSICDDYRFEGVGASTIANLNDKLNDATDCLTAYKAGRVKLKDDAMNDTNYEKIPLFANPLDWTNV